MLGKLDSIVQQVLSINTFPPGPHCRFDLRLRECGRLPALASFSCSTDGQLQFRCGPTSSHKGPGRVFPSEFGCAGAGHIQLFEPSFFSILSPQLAGNFVFAMWMGCRSQKVMIHGHSKEEGNQQSFRRLFSLQEPRKGREERMGVKKDMRLFPCRLRRR